MNKLYAALLIALMLVGLTGGYARAESLSTHSLPHFSREAGSADWYLLRSLGVDVNGLSDENEVVSRGEFFRLVVQLMGKESIAQALTAVPLAGADADEVPEDHRGYLAAAVAFGLLEDGADAHLRPRDPVNLAGALTIALRFLDDELVGDGSDPVEVLLAAEDEGLLDVICDTVRWDEFLTPRQVFSLLATTYRRQPSLGAVLGILAAVDEGVLHLFGPEGAEEHTVALTLYLSGAESLGAATGQMVRGYLDCAGEITYLETHEQISTSRGQLVDYSVRRSQLLLDEEWVPVDLDSELVTWSVNGWGLDRLQQADLLERLQVWADSGAEIAVHHGADAAHRVEVFMWDVPRAVVTALQKDGTDTLVTLRYESPEFSEYPLDAAVVFDGHYAGEVSGDISRVNDLQVGDVLRVATPGAAGMLWDSEYIHHIDVVRNRISGTLHPGRYGMRRSAKQGTSYTLTLDDDRQVEVDPDIYMDDVHQLLEQTAAVELSLDAKGRPLYAPESLVLDDIMSPVQLLEYWETADGCYLQVRHGAFEVVHGTDLDLDVLPDLRHPEGWPTLVSLEFDSDYRVTGVSQPAEVVYRDASVVAVVPGEQVVVLGVDGEPGGPNYVLAVAPVIYDAECYPRQVQYLAVGDEVCVLADGETFVLIENQAE